MIPKHIIEKAIAGGWKPQGITGDLQRHAELFWESVVLSPDFWMALGKEMGWKRGKGKNHDPIWAYNIQGLLIEEPWVNWAMEFMFLTLNKSSQEEIDAYWQSISK